MQKDLNCKSLCSSCKIESKYPDCGALEKDYVHKMGFGVTKCIKYIKKRR